MEPKITAGADIRTDLPSYRISEQGKLETVVKNITNSFRVHYEPFLPAGPFFTPMVVSMRSMKPEQAVRFQAHVVLSSRLTSGNAPENESMPVFQRRRKPLQCGR